MNKNKSFPIGGIILIEKADKYNFFSEVFKLDFDTFFLDSLKTSSILKL